MARTLEWSSPDGAPRRGEFEAVAGTAPRPAAFVVADAHAAAFARALCGEMARTGWSWLYAGAEDLRAAGGDRARGAELEAALAALAQVDGVDEDLLALVGVGEAGTQAFLCACASRRVGAVVDVCGPLIYAGLDAQHPVQPLDMVLNLGAPALLVNAAEDERFGSAAAGAAAARIERALRSVERVELPGRAADFLDATSPGYDRERTAHAARSIASFLRELSDES
ncbi:MAG TPA: dienelactone hydrolase family protein [Planctomycetota bacterium]|nr:dienelactone hydrolase family protein [Planctomycetota bacterium]